MALNFKVYERTESTLDIIGTVASVVGKGGKIRFVPGTFTSNKRVAIILMNNKGESTVVACSNRVSSGLRDALKNGTSKKELAAAVSKLEISEDTEGRNFIIAPIGAGGVEEEFVVDTLKKEAVNFEDLVAF